MSAPRLLMLLTALSMSAGLAACDKYTSSGETVGQRVDKAIDRTNDKVIVAGDKVGATIDKAGNAVSNVADNISTTAAQTGESINDSAITASIKADLLKDPDLDVLKIDVETREGVVTLNGLTYSPAALARAERIAVAVKGVKQVNNYLVVKKG